jgi:hypothetical protein
MLGGFALGVEELDDGGDLVGLERIAEGGHSGTSIVDLVFDLGLLPAFADGAQVGAELAAAAVGTVAVFAAFFVEERCAEALLVGRGSYGRGRRVA